MKQLCERPEENQEHQSVPGQDSDTTRMWERYVTAIRRHDSVWGCGGTPPRITDSGGFEMG
jgi:hypothetical protein